MPLSRWACTRGIWPPRPLSSSWSSNHFEVATPLESLAMDCVPADGDLTAAEVALLSVENASSG